MDKITKVKLKVEDNGDYDYFCNLVNRYEDNTNLFRGRRKLGKVFYVTEHFGIANYLRLKTTAGEQLRGQYNRNLFDVLQAKIGKSIRASVKALWDNTPRDTHSTSTWYAAIDPDTEGTMSLTEMYERDDELPRSEQRTDTEEYKWSTSKYCFAEYRSWGGDEFYKQYPFVIGRIFPYCDVDLFLRMCTEAKKYGWLDKEAEVWTVEAESNEGEDVGTHIEYAIPHNKPYNQSYYYFQLSFMRMCREYAGTVIVASKLMDKYNLNLPLSMCLAYQKCDSPYSLHIAFPQPYEDNDDYRDGSMDSLSVARAIQSYLQMLRDPKNKIDRDYFHTTASIAKIAAEEDKKHIKLEVRNINQINRLIKEVEHG